MPTAPARWCARCAAAHASGIPCPKAMAAKAARDQARPSPSARGYDHHWRIVRAAYLAANPFCVTCGRAATEVDHRDGDSRNNEWGNLRAFCHEHHSSRTARDQGFGKARRRG